LSLLRAVDSMKPDFNLLFVNEHRKGVTIGYSHYFAGKLSKADKRQQEQNRVEEELQFDGLYILFNNTDSS